MSQAGVSGEAAKKLGKGYLYDALLSPSWHLETVETV
jgi:hypothetical protein